MSSEQPGRINAASSVLIASFNLFGSFHVSVERVPVKYVSKNDRFVVNTKNYNQQYNGIYLARLLQMKADLR